MRRACNYTYNYVRITLFDLQARTWISWKPISLKKLSLAKCIEILEKSNKIEISKSSLAFIHTNTYSYQNTKQGGARRNRLKQISTHTHTQKAQYAAHDMIYGLWSRDQHAFVWNEEDSLNMINALCIRT